ncbi:MAG: hypothetical protein R3B74_17535 [Nitrospirales bacterium]|nr:hypothetical protein [Nitrospirales bacterium]
MNNLVMILRIWINDLKQLALIKHSKHWGRVSLVFLMVIPVFGCFQIQEEEIIKISEELKKIREEMKNLRVDGIRGETDLPPYVFPGRALNDQLPTVVLETSAVPKLHVVAPLPNGLGETIWNSSSRSYSPWISYSNGSGISIRDWNPGKVVLIWNHNGSTQQKAFFGYLDHDFQSHLAIPEWFTHQLSWHYQWQDIPALTTTTFSDGLYPQAGYIWRDGQQPRASVFGESFPSNCESTVIDCELREVTWNGNQWQFINHGVPPAPGRQVNIGIRMGSNSAVWDSNTGRKWVFVAREYEKVYIRYLDPNQSQAWEWEDLGVPLSHPRDKQRVDSIRPPIAVSRVENGIFKINMFSVMAVSEQTLNGLKTRWELWERHYNGTQWEPWQAHGPAPGISYVLEGSGEYVYGKGFRISSGVVWTDGNTLRINLFGRTDEEGHLIEYFWDGGTWRWASNRVHPGGERFHTNSSAVYDYANGEYISVVGRTTSGEIWEFYWDAPARSQWEWRKLWP